MRIPRPRFTLGALLILVAVASVPIAIVAPWFNQPRPKAVVVGGPTFIAGLSPIATYRRHSWSIRNEGRAPLILVVSGMSPHCGLSLWEGENRVVPPGGRAEIQLTYATPGANDFRYTAFADLGTNDEDAPKIRLQVDGTTHRQGFQPSMGDPVPVCVTP